MNTLVYEVTFGPADGETEQSELVVLPQAEVAGLGQIETLSVVAGKVLPRLNLGESVRSVTPVQ